MDTIRPRTGLVSPGLERLARDAAHGAPDPTTSAATRYLCVGAHVDPQFADRVIHDVLEERHRAVCPSRGIDLVPIVRHCLAARRRRLARDLAILAVLAASVVVSPVPTATLTLTAWSGWWLHRLARDWVARGPAANLRLLAALAASSSLFVLGAGLALRQAPLASQVIDLRRESLGLVLLPLGVWAVVLVEAAQTRDVLVRQLSRRAFDPGRAPATASPAVQWRLGTSRASSTATPPSTRASFRSSAPACRSVPGRWCSTCNARRGAASSTAPRRHRRRAPHRRAGRPRAAVPGRAHRLLGRGAGGDRAPPVRQHRSHALHGGGELRAPADQCRLPRGRRDALADDPRGAARPGRHDHPDLRERVLPCPRPSGSRAAGADPALARPGDHAGRHPRGPALRLRRADLRARARPAPGTRDLASQRVRGAPGVPR